MKTARSLAAVACAILAAWIVAATAPRVAALATGAPARDGAGETRFWGWTQRDPPLVSRLEAIGRRLEPGEAVVPVCVPECDTGWFAVMAAYALPRQAVVFAKTSGELRDRFPTRIVRTRADMRVEPRSESDAGR